MIWQTARGPLDLGTGGIVMGILNVTPDSFSDGGKFTDPGQAVAHALQMMEDGAGIIDIGGESTRPGAPSVTSSEERRRVLPVIEAVLRQQPRCLISVDTSKAEVARAALEAGAAIVNDISALRGDPTMAAVIASFKAGLVLMHMQGTPQTMQKQPTYSDVLSEVKEELRGQRDAALAAGIAPGCIALDPGIGFGKTVEHNLTLLRRLPELRLGDGPLVVGVSRKSFLSRFTTSTELSERLWPTIALTATLSARGAQVLRVHDVRENVAALRTVEAVLGSV